MKRVRDILRENHDSQHIITKEGFVDIRDDDVREKINAVLRVATEENFITPYVGMEKVAKVLANFHMFVPRVGFMEGDSGVVVAPANQFGEKMGMKDDGSVVEAEESEYSIYFEYEVCEYSGMFIIFCQIVDEDELDELLKDVEEENEDVKDEREEKLDEETLNELSSKKKQEYIKAAETDKKHAERQADFSDYEAKTQNSPDRKKAFKQEADWLKSVVAKRQKGIAMAKGEKLDEINKKTYVGAMFTATDPEGVHTGDPEKIAKRAEKYHGKKFADDLRGMDPKAHFPRKGHSSGFDLMKWRSPTRKTKEGKVNKQDEKSRKNLIKDTLGRHKKANLPEDTKMDDPPFEPTGKTTNAKTPQNVAKRLARRMMKQYKAQADKKK